ncbi:MAG: inorganic diphosphatase [Candidatus Zambryskibacteria bacterium]|nr:inorganic diphosphatase [Candidatus Zambryskibacteria bacterium]
MNLIKDIQPGTPEEMNVIVEIGRGSKNKYEVDKKTGLIALDRTMFTAENYPYDYGFVPQTLWDDNDPLDVIVLTTNPLESGVLVRVRPVAMMEMIDEGKSDVKIITVPVSDPDWDRVKDLEDIDEHILKEMRHFYSTYKANQNKKVVVGNFDGKNKAIETFHKAIKLYKEHKKD